MKTIAFSLFSFTMLAQQVDIYPRTAIATTTKGTSTPSACMAPSFFIRTDTQALYMCIAGAFVAVGGGGGSSAWGGITGTLSAQTDLQNALDLKSPLASPTFSGTVGGVTKSMVGLGSVDNTADTAKPVSTAAQTALDLKAPIASPTFSGTVAGVTKAMVGLGSVDNTADTAKPVSTATQTALDLKAPLASPTFTGTTTMGITVADPLKGLLGTDIATPANPASSHTLLYPKGGKWCSLSPAGVEACTGASGTFDPSTAYTWSADQSIDGTHKWIWNGVAGLGSYPIALWKTNESAATDFAMNVTTTAGSNGATAQDNFLTMGYNCGQSGAKIKSTEQMFCWNLENDYTTAQSIRQMEFYFTFINRDGSFGARPLAITSHLADTTLQIDMSFTALNFWQPNGSTPIASFVPGGPTFYGGDAYFNAAAHTAQVNFGLMTAARTYSFPDSTGTFVLSDGSSLTTLGGGLTIGGSGAQANQIRTLQLRSTDGTGAYISTEAGGSIFVIGQNTTHPTLRIIPKASQTASLVELDDSGNSIIAEVTVAGKGIFNGLGIGTTASFASVATLNGTFTGNRTITVIDATGTMGLKVSAPATASTACIVGQWAADTSFHYDCTATNTWLRAAIATW